MILGLDISTSITGATLIDTNGNVVVMESIDTRKYKNFFEKAEKVKLFLTNLSKEHKVEDKIIMMGDPFLNFTKSIGADVDKSERGLGIRSNRYTMLIDDLNVIKLQEEKDTGSCEISAAENFLQLV